MFIKGLELYGKAWKKIAMAIKTRTVVQIRTHAQKYFLKLSKARQNGDHLFGRGIGPGTKRRKSRHDRSASLCVALQPFMVKPNPSSASSSSLSASASASALESTSAPVNTDASLMPPPLSTHGLTTMGTSSFDAQAPGPAPAPVRLTQSEVEKCLYNFLSPDLHKADRAPTEWYQRGLPISSLLADAEKLDWVTDGGIAVMPSAITSTSAAFKETKVSAESTAAKMASQATTTSFDALAGMGYMAGGGVRGIAAGSGGMKAVGGFSGGTYDFNGEDDIFSDVLEHGYAVGLGL